MTQKEEVYRYLLENSSISQMEAYSKLLVCRLSERIRELEGDGINIIRTRVPFKNKYGRRGTYVRYSLGEQDERICEIA